MKLLIVEDDQNASRFINFAFRTGWTSARVVSALNGLKGVELAESEKPDESNEFGNFQVFRLL